MPIYAYRCAACGHSRDVLQKLSDAPLVVCPACGAEQFAKQLTAAGFQLKGSGWYATDFRNGSAASTTKTPGTDSGSGGASPGAGDSASSTSASGGSGSASAAGGTPCGGSCACH
jgi:putative FmdB family regulatory protein